jgi:hypothetical protein
VDFESKISDFLQLLLQKFGSKAHDIDNVWSWHLLPIMAASQTRHFSKLITVFCPALPPFGSKQREAANGTDEKSG